MDLLVEHLSASNSSRPLERCNEPRRISAHIGMGMEALRSKQLERRA